ncbi:MAG: flavin reductase family protein [Candidatus Pseudomonas colombiensis]|uniref:Flavin reductase family protein n=1 Tax=Pseudomonas morbosilactucae TaxID=2938197 RepID=A0ABT0JGZ2_9PSED|nr:flavin reductase family protein [Pseudomonas morbosilactucae]MCK9815143.1 flavin reductase family protein [Pseudomonas morbosilactucae]WEK12191.1 MAG: flavin reductase family protein [Pseudomonas sp.]
MTTGSLQPALVKAEDGDPRELRNLLGQFATGVTVITTRTADGRNVGMTANSFSSVSLDPPLVLWSLSRTAPSLGDYLAASHFAINVLGAEQHDLSGRFARPAADKFAGVDFTPGQAGVPLLDGVIATLVCRNVTQYDGGDHLIFLGQIEHYRHGPGEPLVFHRGQYRVATAHPALAG